MPKSGKKNSGRKAQKLPSEHWKREPDDHDYPAAGDYLSLLMVDAKVKAAVTALKRAPLTHRKAKDLLRASSLELLPADNVHVAGDLAKVRRGQLLSPVLLLRGNAGKELALTVADGYHRICASYHINEDADIPCRIANAPSP